MPLKVDPKALETDNIGLPSRNSDAVSYSYPPLELQKQSLLLSDSDTLMLSSNVPLGLQIPEFRVYPLHVSGSPSNRVNLVFFADGYTYLERKKFIDDAGRLANDLSANQTFAPVLPLLNFYAAFSPSNESGIGVGGSPKDTVFGLYRDGTELRAIYTSKPDLSENVCSLLPGQCDYPILLGNDPLYGGLGGDYSITTASMLNGALVLRHELGHSIIKVGEEYDGGFAYFGANAEENITNSPIKWSHWLNQGSPSSDSHSHISTSHSQSANLEHQSDGVSVSPSPHTSRVERSVMPLQDYPWTLLNYSTPYTSTFVSSGTYARHLVKFSLSGVPIASHLHVRLDGVDLGWKPYNGIGVDRWFYDVWGHGALEEGVHTLEFELTRDGLEGVAQLCSFEVLEYGDDDEFDITPGTISAFPTFSMDNTTSYRPTNEGCLMRSVTFPNFCSPCLESLWLHLLESIDLIEDVVTTARQSSINSKSNFLVGSQLEVSIAPVPFGDSTNWKYQNLQSTTLPLPSSSATQAQAQHSSPNYSITWTRNGTILSEFQNLKTAVLRNWDDGKDGGSLRIDVKLSTEDVRVDEKGSLTAFRVI